MAIVYLRSAHDSRYTGFTTSPNDAREGKFNAEYAEDAWFDRLTMRISSS
jgi:hypothetical protein